MAAAHKFFLTNTEIQKTINSNTKAKIILLKRLLCTFFLSNTNTKYKYKIHKYFSRNNTHYKGSIRWYQWKWRRQTQKCNKHKTNADKRCQKNKYNTHRMPQMRDKLGKSKDKSGQNSTLNCHFSITIITSITNLTSFNSFTCFTLWSVPMFLDVLVCLHISMSVCEAGTSWVKVRTKNH